MKELEFRVWTGSQMEYNVMVGKFGAFYVNPANNGMDENDAASLTPLNTKYPDTCPVMQYINRKDMNGRKIYGGDFLKLSDDWRGKGEIPAYVIFENSRWMLQGTMHYSHKDDITNYSLDRMVVIGNIYENPELLQEYNKH